MCACMTPHGVNVMHKARLHGSHDALRLSCHCQCGAHFNTHAHTHTHARTHAQERGSDHTAVQFPECRTSRLSASLLAALAQALDEAAQGLKPAGAEHTPGLRHALFAASRDAVSVWVCTVQGTLLGSSTRESHSKELDPSAVALAHNDCMLIAHALTGVALRWRALGVDGDETCMVTLVNDVRALAVCALTRVLDVHKQRIHALLDGWLQGVSDGRGDEEAATAVLRAGIEGIKKLGEDVLWQTLPLHVYRRAVAGVVDVWYSSVAAAVLSMRDIPSREVCASCVCMYVYA
jgi:hypothetical protein